MYVIIVDYLLQVAVPIADCNIYSVVGYYLILKAFASKSEVISKHAILVEELIDNGDKHHDVLCQFNCR